MYGIAWVSGMIEWGKLTRVGRLWGQLVEMWYSQGVGNARMGKTDLSGKIGEVWYSQSVRNDRMGQTDLSGKTMRSIRGSVV